MLLPGILQNSLRRLAIGARPVRVNERIRIREVRLIDEDGNQLGVVATRDALDIAREKGLDLARSAQRCAAGVSPHGLRRFRYEESRRERESRRKAKGATLKEVRMAPKIDDHDIQTKARQAQRFLEAGDKVKISVLFRGREMLHQDIGRNLLMNLVQQLSDVSTVDQDPRMEGRSMSVMLSPKKDAQRQEAARAAQESRQEQAGAESAS